MPTGIIEWIERQPVLRDAGDTYPSYDPRLVKKAYFEADLSMILNASNAALITPSDTADLGFVTDYISLTNSGTQTLHITTAGGQDITITGLVTGTMHPIRARRVFATGTTVTTIVGWWT